MKQSVNIIFPHQLFASSALLENGQETYIIEEFLFFNQYPFHQQKIAFHRASMKHYQSYLESIGLVVHYIEQSNTLADIRAFASEITTKGIQEIHVIDPTDYWLEKRLRSHQKLCKIHLYENPQFINTKEDLHPFFRVDKKSFFQTTFYKQQRKKMHLLMDENGNPEGGKWTYDIDNRKKYPKSKNPPAIKFPEESSYWNEAVTYTRKHFSKNPGVLSNERFYPINHQETQDWCKQFLRIRFHDFGTYEDAIVKEHIILNHSVLSPLLNAGLIMPRDLIHQSAAFAKENEVPLNSVEGFIRQIIGWREFIRGMYACKGTYSRTQNFWNFNRKIPTSFYTGTTGITPVDDTINKVLKTGYCHHIERLMILGNFMLLCEFDPKEVYRWFMELFIDAYDWVMVPNVYGMSQFADGGTFATKPYIGGSNYIKKMSNYPKGDWEAVWDGLFWRFIDRQKSFFISNPRLGMMVHTLSKMSEEKRQGHFNNANAFLANL